MTIRIGKKFFIIAALIIAAVAGAYGYYHFYYTRTPEYTLQIIRTAVKDHDADTFNKHVDIDSIIGKWIDGEMEKDESIKANPFAAALIPVAKNILTTSVKNAVNAAITDTPKATAANTPGQSTPADTIISEKNDLSIGNISSVKNADKTADISIVVENKKKNTSTTLKLKAVSLEDGTWKITELENPEEIKNL